MNFITGLLLALRKKDSILIIVDRLTKSSHFLPVRTDYMLEKYVEFYINEVVRPHGFLILIILDKDPRFTSRFLEKLHEVLGTRLNFSTSFHFHTNDQSNIVIQVLEDMFRSCVNEFEGSWERHLPLIEFVYNNIYQVDIKMAFHKALYGRKC